MTQTVVSTGASAGIRRGASRLTVAGRCRTAGPGWLLRNAIQDQHTGPAGRSREKSASTVTTVRTLVRR